MRKFYLLFAAMIGFAAVANAGIKNLYKQDFEAVKTVADAGWTSPNLAGGMSLYSTEYGKWFRFSLGANNNRNSVMNFNYGLESGTTIYTGQDLKNYTVKFQWGLVGNPVSTGNAANVQYSSEVALLADPAVTADDVPEGWKITSVINNGQYAGKDTLRLFSMTQLKGAYSDSNIYWTDNTDNSNYIFDYYINGDQENKVTLEEGMWYDVTVNIDTEARTAAYEIYTLTGDEVAKGTYTIPAYTSVYAKGLNVLLGRYNSVIDVDEVKVQVPVDGDFANAPSISLVGLDQTQRSFDIYFEEGEILHVKKTDGAEATAVESPYRYETSTSGTLEVWTESGSATSEHITYDVDCSVISLPVADVDITSVNAGYVKTYKLTVDNSDVPTQPQITLTYKYVAADGTVIEDHTDEVPSGSLVSVDQKGTLYVTTHAYGFAETEVSVLNDVEFAVDQTIDFQHMTDAQLVEKGFAEIDPLDASNMSGENNWTARERLCFYIETGETDAEGKALTEKHVVYGPTANGGEAIRRFTFASAGLTPEVAKSLFAPFYVWSTASGDGEDVAPLKVNYGIGLINTGTKGTGTSINYANGVVGIDGLTDSDFYIAYIVSDYGTSSAHPVYPAGTSVADAIAAYKAGNIGNGTNVQVLRGTDTYSLYRIDTAIARIDIFKAQNVSEGVEVIRTEGEVVSDHNAPIYNLNGVQVNPSTLKKGIYVKQGKKFVVQ